ncbi:hypothetical protein AAY473_026566 [Plecturocebus cupreus]
MRSALRCAERTNHFCTEKPKAQEKVSKSRSSPIPSSAHPGPGSGLPDPRRDRRRRKRCESSENIRLTVPGLGPTPAVLARPGSGPRFGPGFRPSLANGCESETARASPRVRDRWNTDLASGCRIQLGSLDREKPTLLGKTGQKEVPTTSAPNHLRLTFGQPRRQSGKNRHVQGPLVRSGAGPAGQGHGAASLRPKSKTLQPPSSPAPRVTRVPSPLQRAAASSSTPVLLQMRTRAGLPGLPAPGLRERGAGGRVLAHTARLAEQVCVPARSAPGPGPSGHQRRDAAPPRPRPSPTSLRSVARELTPLLPGLCGPGGIGTEDASSAFPRRSFCLSPLCAFPFAGRAHETERGGGQASPFAASSLPALFSLYFSFISPLPFKPSPERRREAGRGCWALWAASAVLSLSGSGAGSRRRRETSDGLGRPGRAEPPHLWPGPHAPTRCDARPAQGRNTGSPVEPHPRPENAACS